MLARKKILPIMLAVFIGFFILGTLNDNVNERDLDAIEEIKKIVKTLSPEAIFYHNLPLNLIMMIPGFGIIFAMASAFTTGHLASVLILNYGIDTNPILFLLATPYGLMELVSYAVAMSRGTILLIAIIRRKTVPFETRKHLEQCFMDIGIIVALLAFGAIVEFYMIEHSIDFGLLGF